MHFSRIKRDINLDFGLKNQILTMEVGRGPISKDELPFMPSWNYVEISRNDPCPPYVVGANMLISDSSA